MSSAFPPKEHNPHEWAAMHSEPRREDKHDPNLDSVAEDAVVEGADADDDGPVDVDGDGQCTGYEVFTKAELIAHIDTLNEQLPDERKLSTAGNKPDLVRRIQEHDAAQGDQP